VSATLLNTVLAAFGFQKLEKLMDVQKDFRKYDAHKIAPSEIHFPKKPLTMPVLDPKEFHKFSLVRKATLSPNVYRFVCAPKANRCPRSANRPARRHPQREEVSRSYTPTSNNTNLGRFELVVKVYPGGLITNYLASLNPGDLVEFRGPKRVMKYHSKTL